MTFGVGCHLALIVKIIIKGNNRNIVIKIRFFPIIGKENNQSPVSDADREIPALGATDNAGNLINPFPSLSIYPPGLDLSVCTGDR